MNCSWARRAIAGLVVVTASFAAASFAPAAPARAADRPLVAGAAVQVSAAPGGTFQAPLSVTNRGSAAVDGAAIWFGMIRGFESASRFANCAYDAYGLQSCAFDEVLQPGRTYRVALALRAPADAYAPGAMTARFQWLTGAEYDRLGGPGPWSPGDGETLRLEEAAPGSPGAGTAWQSVDVEITGKQGADLAALGAKVYGAAGDVVQAEVGVRNNGPATLDWSMTGTSPGLVIVTIPPGTSVETTPARCALAGDDLQTRPGVVQYACETANRFAVGATATWTFGLRVDQVIRDAAGAVEVNPACQCQRFADDLDRSNDDAPLVVNPAPTVPGSPDTNPPVVSATGLIDGQLLALYQDATPIWSDDVAVTKVQVLVNGEVTETYEGELPRKVEVMPPTRLHGQEARVTIKAFDAAGNSGERSTPVRVDVREPEATVTPAFGSTVSGLVTFRATNVAADTERMEMTDWDGTVVARSTAAPWTMTWDTRGLDGDQSMTIRLFDRAGNVQFEFGSYRADNSGPVVRSLTPGHRALVRGSVRTTVQAADPSGIRSARVTGGRATGTPLTWTVGLKAQGQHTIEWVLTDQLGHTTVARRVVVNDTVKPTLKLTKAPKNGAKLKKAVKLAASAADRNGVARVQLLVNGKVVATDTKAGYTFTLNPKKYGKKFTVQVRGYDKAGNATLSPKRTYRR
jgi:hypothetical protein